MNKPFFILAVPRTKSSGSKRKAAKKRAPKKPKSEKNGRAGGSMEDPEERDIFGNLA